MSFEITTSNGVFFIPARTLAQARSLAFLDHGISAEDIKDWRFVQKPSLAAKNRGRGWKKSELNPTGAAHDGSHDAI